MSLLKALSFGVSATVAAFALSEIKASKGDEEKDADFLLILGCRVRGTEAEATLKMRIEKAARYLKEKESTLAICCGGIVHSDQLISEAEVIKRELIAHGIDENRILLEDKSRTTRENFINAKAIIEEIKDENEPVLAFLSSEFHLLRAGEIAKLCGVKAFSLAAESPKEEKIKNYIREFFCFPMVYIEGGKK